MPEAGEVIARALHAYERGFDRHADAILRHAVHDGVEPIDLILTAVATEPRDITPPPTPTREPVMKVRYIGPSGAGVNVGHPDPDSPDASTVTRCPPGEPVDLPDQQARSLIDAGVFEPVTETRRAPKRNHEES